MDRCNVGETQANTAYIEVENTGTEKALHANVVSGEIRIAEKPMAYQSLNLTKFFLILGVVLIHSNLFADVSTKKLSGFSEVGFRMVSFISERLMSVCVPGFYVISGFLFFRNVRIFRITTWKTKLATRCHTLLLPYIIWNALGCILAMVKTTYLGFPGYGIIADGHINMIRILVGFVDFSNGYPYAFAFWFIRNLMVFVVLSPVAYFIARRKWIFLFFILTICTIDTGLMGFEYFVIGAFLAMHRPYFIQETTRLGALTGAAVWVVGSIILMELELSRLSLALHISCSVGALAFILWGARGICQNPLPRLLGQLVSSTFFIYAIHQFFCTVCRKFFISIFGLSTFPEVAGAYVCSFLTLVILPFGCWLLLQKYAPRLTSFLGGGR